MQPEAIGMPPIPSTENETRIIRSCSSKNYGRMQLSWMGFEFSKALRSHSVLDGRVIHTQNIELIEIARKNGVILLCFSPRCKPRLQPLSVGFMKGLKPFTIKQLLSG